LVPETDEVVVDVEVVVVVVPSSLVIVSVTSFLTSGSLLILVTQSWVAVSYSFSRVLISSSLVVTDLPEVSSLISSVNFETRASHLSINPSITFFSFSVVSILVSIILI